MPPVKTFLGETDEEFEKRYQAALRAAEKANLDEGFGRATRADVMAKEAELEALSIEKANRAARKRSATTILGK